MYPRRDNEQTDDLVGTEDQHLHQASLLPQDIGGEIADEDAFDDDADDTTPHDADSLSETHEVQTEDATRLPHFRVPIVDTTAEVRHTACPPTLSQFATALVL